MPAVDASGSKLQVQRKCSRSGKIGQIKRLLVNQTPSLPFRRWPGGPSRSTGFRTRATICRLGKRPQTRWQLNGTSQQSNTTSAVYRVISLHVFLLDDLQHHLAARGGNQLSFLARQSALLVLASKTLPVSAGIHKKFNTAALGVWDAAGVLPQAKDL